MEYKEIPFDLETALEHPEWVYTRDGYKCRILATDKLDNYGFSVVVAVKVKLDREIIACVSSKGDSDKSDTNNYDLVLRKPATKVKKYFITYYSILEEEMCADGLLYDTYEDAKESFERYNSKYIAKDSLEIHEIKVTVYE